MRKREIIINVTARDIDIGHCGSSRKCPIARAVNRRLVPGVQAHIGSTTVCFVRGNKPAFGYAPLSKTAYNFVIGFDQLDDDAKPFKFKIRALAHLFK